MISEWGSFAAARQPRQGGRPEMALMGLSILQPFGKMKARVNTLADVGNSTREMKVVPAEPTGTSFIGLVTVALTVTSLLLVLFKLPAPVDEETGHSSERRAQCERPLCICLANTTFHIPCTASKELLYLVGGRRRRCIHFRPRS